MQLAGALTVATTGLSAAQAVHQQKIGKANVKAEKKLGELRADERRDKLRRTLGSMRVAMVSQGSDPDFGSNLVLFEEARKAAERESAIDNFQTGIRKANIKGGATSGVFRSIGGRGKSLLSYTQAKKETKVA